MTRKDFELIAETLFEISELGGKKWHPEAERLRCNLALDFASKLAHTNPNFNRSRFLRACGVED